MWICWPHMNKSCGMAVWSFISLLWYAQLVNQLFQPCQNFVFFKDQTSYTTQFWSILHQGLHPLDQLDPCSMIWFLWSCIGGYHSSVFRSPCISTGIGSIPSALGHQCWCGVSPCILWLGCHWRQSWGHEWLWAPCLGSSGRCHTLPGFSVVSLWRVLHWLVWSPRSCCPWSGQKFLSSSFLGPSVCLDCCPDRKCCFFRVTLACWFLGFFWRISLVVWVIFCNC